MKLITKLWHVALIGARSSLAYSNETIGRVVFLATIMFIFSKLWKTVYGQMHTDYLGGLRIEEMMMYFVITEAVGMSAPRLSFTVDEEVRNGQVALHLIRPLPYPVYRLAVAMGERVPRFLIVFAIGCALLELLMGSLPLKLTGLACLLCVLPLAFMLDSCASFLVGLFAFWCEDTAGIFLIYQRLVMLLGGMLIPLELFPKQWQPILHALPTAAMIYGPARIAVRPNDASLAGLLQFQALAFGFFLLIVLVVYKFALRRVSAQGG